MALLNDDIRSQVKEMLTDLPHDVRLLVFTKPEGCPYCSIVQELMEEIAEASDRVSVETYDITEDTEEAETYSVTRAPAIAIVGERDYGLRFFGIPANYEFSTLLHGIQVAGQGASADLDNATKSYLSTIDQPVHYQVFVTPTCPYCPGAAVLAYDMAVESEWVRSDVIEASEFQELAGKYEVRGVPLNVINDTQRQEGRAPANMIVEKIKAALS
ncbi:MAG: protein disulfide oxidoreductase [Anaerolineales bacterium]